MPTRRQRARSKPVWYAEGLHFECQACGRCCSGPPGYVWLDPAEAYQIADFLRLSPHQFFTRYLRLIDGQLSLIELSGGDCIFLDPESRLCRIYPVRPRQCRTWPFWSSNLISRRAWEEAAARCPGCNRGRLYTLEEIEELRRQI